jgi:hypothetical protein
MELCRSVNHITPVLGQKNEKEIMGSRGPLALAFFFASDIAFADLSVAPVDELNLPYGLSPSNYNNSPSNYANSISNYDNSPSNYDNSESNYNNSASNYNNGRSGGKRLIFKDGGSLKFAGYYISASNGVTNFFSISGKRMFYNPKKSSAVFGGQDGNFCGVLAHVDGEYSLALTQHGMRILFLSQ